MLLLALSISSDTDQPGVGNIAINDAFMLEAAIYKLLKAHFKKDKYYVDLLELFLEVRSLTWLMSVLIQCRPLSRRRWGSSSTC